MAVVDQFCLEIPYTFDYLQMKAEEAHSSIVDESVQSVAVG